MSATKPLSHFQFSLRWLFVAIGATAVCALVARNCGYIESAGTAISLLLFTAGLCLRSVRFGWLLRGAATTLAAASLWFVAVDYSEFHQHCKHCGTYWFEAEFRVFGVSIWSRKYPDHNDLQSRIAQDLGALPAPVPPLA